MLLNYFLPSKIYQISPTEKCFTTLLNKYDSKVKGKSQGSKLFYKPRLIKQKPQVLAICSSTLLCFIALLLNAICEWFQPLKFVTTMVMANGYQEPKNELFFSLPAGKPPFLGISYETLDLYILPKEFLSDDPKEIFLYYTRDRINIRAQLSNGTVVRFFSQLRYDRTKLLLWLDTIKNLEEIVFGILLKKDQSVELVKHPKTQQPYFFKIRRLYLVDIKDKTVLKVIR